jgi:hypothetical protein
MLTLPYEQLDFNLNEAKQDNQIKTLAEWTGSSLDKLMSFLESE